MRFGKEGRNLYAEFDGNDYLNRRSDDRVAGISPLVHYIKYRKKRKIGIIDSLPIALNFYRLGINPVFLFFK